MRLLALAAVAGFCAFAIAYLGLRMLAPHYGLTPFLVSAVAGVALGALALAQSLGPRSAGSRSSLGGPATFAGAWTMAMPWIRDPILSTLDPVAPVAAAVLAAALLIGPPLIALGIVLPVVLRLQAPTLAAVGRAAARTLGAALAGTMFAATLVPLALVPMLGLRRAALVVAFLQLGATALAFGVRGSVAAPAVVAAIGVALLRWGPPVGAADPRLGVQEVREGAVSELRVLDRNGARYLLADGTVHTVIATDNSAPLTRSCAALELLKLLQPRPDTMLVLGLRGGAVARAFARDGWRVRVVDPDPDAAALTARWMGLAPEDARITAADPRVFLRANTGTYPLIVLDAYADSAIPPHLVTAEFFDLVASRLGRDGIVALSIETQGWHDPLAASLAATLRRRFRVVRALPTAEPPDRLGALVLLAANRELEIPDERLPDPSNYHADPEGQWVVQQINHAWLNRFEPEAAGARVLTDDGVAIDRWSERLNAATRRELRAFFGGGS